MRCSICPSFHRNFPSLPLGCRQVPSPCRMSLRNSPSQIYPLAHWNLPHPCLASPRYSPSNWSPVQDFHTPCPSRLPFTKLPSQELPFFHLQEPLPWNLPSQKPPEQVSPLTSFSNPVLCLTPLTTSPSQKSPSLLSMNADPVFSPATNLPMYLVPFSSMWLPVPWGLPFSHSPSQHMYSSCLSGLAGKILMVPLPWRAPSLNSPRQRYFCGTYSKPKPFFWPSLGRSVSQLPKQKVPLKYQTMFLSAVSWQYTPFLNFRTVTFSFILSSFTPKIAQTEPACCSYSLRLPKVEGGSGGKLAGICSLFEILSRKSSVTDWISHSGTLCLKTWMSSKTMRGSLDSCSPCFSASSLLGSAGASAGVSLADFCLTLQLDMALAFSSGFFLRVELFFISLETSSSSATGSSICGLHLKQVDASSLVLLNLRDRLPLWGESSLLTSLPASDRLSMVLLSCWWESDQAVCGWGCVSMVRLMILSVSSSSSSLMRSLRWLISWLRVLRQFSRLSSSPTAMLQMFLLRLNRLFCSRIMFSPTRRSYCSAAFAGASGLGCERSCMSLAMAWVWGLVGRRERGWGWWRASWRSWGSAWMLISQRECGWLFLELLILFYQSLKVCPLLVQSSTCLSFNRGSIVRVSIRQQNGEREKKQAVCYAENQFQVRKMPLRRALPEKTPELYALDVHSICLPSRSRKAINWGSLHPEPYEEEFNPQIIYSPAYQQLYAQYLALRDTHTQQRAALQQEIEGVESLVSKEEEGKRRLQGLREGLYSEIEHLRENLNEVRDKNYNLRWEIYHQRGAHYMNMNGYSFLHGNELTAEELLQMEEQMAAAPKGLSQEQIAALPTLQYAPAEGSAEICCICFDELQEGETLLAIHCHHLQHSDCLRDWLVKQRVCPICKQDVLPTQE